VVGSSFVVSCVVLSDVVFCGGPWRGWWVVDGAGRGRGVVGGVGGGGGGGGGGGCGWVGGGGMCGGGGGVGGGGQCPSNFLKAFLVLSVRRLEARA